MLRKLSIALLASTFLSSATLPARSEPISTVIGLTAIISSTLAVSTATAAAIGSFIITTSISVGLSLLSSALAPKPEQPASGTMLQTQYGGAVPRSAIYGHQIVAGHHVYSNVYGPENKHLQVVHVLGDGLHDSLTRIWFNGKECPLYPHPSWDGVSNPETYFVDHRGLGVSGEPLPIEGTVPKVYLRFYRGEWDQFADGNMVANSNPVGRWTTNHRGRGICYAAIEQEWNEEEGLTGFPDVRYEIKGLKLYDSRFDTINGGSGSQRWGTPSTYVWSDNSAVLEYNYRRGHYLNDQLILGMGVGPADLILPMYVAAANDCEDAIPLAGGGTEPRYRCNTTISAKQQHSQALDVIQASMAGHMLERAGQFGPIPGVAQTVKTELSFTDDDLLVGQGAEFSKYRSRSEIFTAIYGSYSDPNQKGESVGFPAREDAADDLAMGERLAQDIDLTQIRSVSQAQRIAEIARRSSLVQEHGTVSLGSKWIAVQPGDWITFNSARHGTLTVQVVGTSLNPDHSVRLIWRAITSTVYSWSTAGELEGPFIPTGPQPGTLITAASGVAAIPVSMPGDNGLVHPGIKLTWTAITDPSVDCLQFEIRKSGDTEVIPFRADFPAAGLAVVSGGIQAATLYEFRHRIVTTPERICPWSAWAPVTTPAEHVVPTAQTALLVNLSALTEEVRTELLRIDDARDSMMQLLARVVAEQDAQNYLNDKNRKTEAYIHLIKAEQDTAAAMVSVRSLVSVDIETAVSTYDVTVTASLGDLEALVATNSTAIATHTGQLAAIWQLDVNAGSKVAGMKLGNDGTTSFFDIEVDAIRFGYTAGGNSFVTIFQIANVDGVAKVAFKGDMIADGDITALKIGAGEVETNHLIAGIINVDTLIVDNLILMDHLVAGAASALNYASHAGASISTGVEGNAVTVTMNVTGGVAHCVYDNASFSMPSTGGSPSATIRWYVDGVNYDDGSGGGHRSTGSIIYVAGAGWAMPVTIGRTFTGLSNGSHTFNVRIFASGATLTVSQGDLYVQELRKAGT